MGQKRAPGCGNNGGAGPVSVTVNVLDANTNAAKVTADTLITLSKAAGTGTLSGTLTGVVAHAGIPGSLVDKFEALPFRIYYLAAEHRNPQELDQGFATALVLLSLTGLLFLAAVLLQRSVESRWQTR